MTTLGPRGTDAEAEAVATAADVRFAPSFPEAMRTAYEGRHHALIAAGFVDGNRDAEASCWVDLHFGYLHRMRLAATWESPTKPMGLAVRVESELDQHSISTLALHRSTRELVAKQVPTSVQLRFVPAKPLAVDMLVQAEVDACIGSLDVLAQHRGLQVLQEYRPSMVWCLYEPRSDS